MNELMKEKLDSAEKRMKKHIERLQSEFSTIRAGRANPAVLDRIPVDYYGAPTPINQLANVSTPEARMLLIAPWDVSSIKAITKAILASDLGITPTDDGKTIYVFSCKLDPAYKSQKLCARIVSEGRLGTPIQIVANDKVFELPDKGFDGVYLDIVDGYEYFENGKDMCINRETQRPYREDMKRFVATLVRYARRTSPRFLIFQQNALAMLVDYAYMRLLDGIGAEDVFTDGNKFNSDRDMRESLRYLKKAQSTGLKIMIVDYAKQAILQELILKNATANRLDFLMTDRELTKLGTFVIINESSMDSKGGGKRQGIYFSTP